MTYEKKIFIRFAKKKITSIVSTNPAAQMEILKNFNLMEDTYGSDWAKEFVGKYKPSFDCTIGK